MRKLLEEQTDCYRLFHGAVEGCPGLTVDRYGAVSHVLVLHRRSVVFTGGGGEGGIKFLMIAQAVDHMMFDSSVDDMSESFPRRHAIRPFVHDRFLRASSVPSWRNVAP